MSTGAGAPSAASYAHDPVLVGEGWIGDPVRASFDQSSLTAHLVFNFGLLFCGLEGGGDAPAPSIARWRAGVAGGGGRAVPCGCCRTTMWFAIRLVTAGVRSAFAKPGLRCCCILALPGAVFLYQGEELGLEEVELPDDALLDPVWENSGSRRARSRWRHGCHCRGRGSGPPYGFTTGVGTWLPQPADWETLSVQAEVADSTSMLGFYRTAVARRPRALDVSAPLQWNRSEAALDLVVAGDPGIRCVVNLGVEPIEIPAGELLMSSADVRGRSLPVDCAAWIAVDG